MRRHLIHEEFEKLMKGFCAPCQSLEGNILDSLIGRTRLHLSSATRTSGLAPGLRRAFLLHFKIQFMHKKTLAEFGVD